MGWFNKNKPGTTKPEAETKKTISINPPLQAVDMSGCSFEYKGKKYKIVIPKFRIPTVNDGQPITAKEALTEPEALKYLVENKSAVIKEIV